MHYISHEHLSLEKVQQIIEKGDKLALSEEAVAAIEKCR